MILHLGEKPYICTSEGCGKRFTEYSSLYKHHVVHTHKKPYECADCGKTYRQISTLATHRRMSHCDMTDVTSDTPELAETETDMSSAFFLTPGNFMCAVCVHWLGHLACASKPIRMSVSGGGLA